MAMSRWIAPAALASALALGALAAPAPAHAQSYDLSRAIVDIADVVFRGNQPYYRDGNYSQNDQLVVGRDRYGRPVYYRRTGTYNDRYGNGYVRNSPPYGNAYGYYGQAQNQVKCNKHGKCKSKYYDPRYDQSDRYGTDRYARNYNRDDRDDDDRNDRRWGDDD